jgi:hypothetical protein
MAILSTSLLNTPSPISPILTTDSAVTVILFCNLNTFDPSDITAGKQYIDIYVVASGASPSDLNKIANQVPVDAGDTFTFSTERLVLSPNDRIYAATTTSGEVSVTISYVVI